MVKTVEVDSPEEQGPSWLVTMPDDSTEEELTYMTKAFLQTFPTKVVGQVVLVTAFDKRADKVLILRSIFNQGIPGHGVIYQGDRHVRSY